MVRLEMRAALASFSRVLLVANSIGKKRLSALASDLSVFGGGLSFGSPSFFFFGRIGGPEVSVLAWWVSSSLGGSEPPPEVMASPFISLLSEENCCAPMTTIHVDETPGGVLKFESDDVETLGPRGDIVML